MATTQVYDSSNLPISNADFESIKQDLINFYKSTEEFRDYDFESSRMSQQMNLMAYVTLYNQQYSNVALYESFLRTAQSREAIVQNAQDKGYVPASELASKDKIEIYITTLADSTPTSVLLPANTPFIGIVDGIYNYNFITWFDKNIPYDDTNENYHDEIEIVQGYRAVQYFTFSDESEIVLFDDDIDRNYINVYITDNTGNTTGQYTNWTNKSIVSIDPSYKAFYVNETSDGYTRIYFGMGVEDDTDETVCNYIGGLRPTVGSTVKVEYLKTDGKIANGAINYSFVGTLDNAVVSSIESNPNFDPLYNGSYGGGDKESPERIRINASLYQETQKRAVTEYDYESFVRSNFGSYVQAVKVYGNSDNPGYVFIAIKPIDALELTELQTSDVTNFLKQYNILTVTPVIVTPQYLYVNHFVNVNYTPSAVPQGTAYLRDQITNALDKYYTDEVELFGGAYHTSRALTAIDNCNDSILGSYMTITIVLEVNGDIVASPAIGLDLMNPIYDVWSTPITYTNNLNVSSEFTMFSLSGDLVAGPFTEGDISDDIDTYPAGTYIRIIITEGAFDSGIASGKYIEETFTITEDDYYYKIGEVNTDSGIITYDFNTIGIAFNIYTPQLKFEATTVRTDIYSKDGGIIIFEPALKPEYLTITTEQI